MRKICFLCVLLISSVYAVSQTILLDPAEIYIGTSHGATASMVMFTPNVEQDILIGYNGGVTFRYVTEKNLGMQIELNLSQRGWKEKENLYAKRLNYIELPFLAHIYFGKKSRFVFNIGPKAAFLIGEKTLIDNTGASTRPQHTKEIQSKFDYGVTAGLGFEFSVKKQNFSLEARANYSLSNIYHRNWKTFRYSDNMNLALNLGWLMKINK
ncbi:PorT family protein [Paludibacter sp. 221]|uniref:porin family protein n=1 Tax=Paludibacter sp. 221 TaxID=2302939 RepID=UPI0013D3FBDB|nr:porin family protein [Paludibacter sp. 221]NDV45871.1 PorT family protein [Paludibacter sp. 221]